MTVSLIIPAYDEEERMPRFLELLATFVHSHPNLIQETLVVDDGSSDQTSKIAESFRDRLPGFRTLRQPTNRGKGAAVQLGISVARAQAVVFADADGATAPEELPKILAHLDGAPIVVGDRWTSRAAVHSQTPLRSISSRLLRPYMALFGLGNVDTMCGCKAFRRDVAVRLFHPLLEQRWLFDQEVLFRARLLGLPIKSVPISWASQRGSKLHFTTLIRSALVLPFLLGRVWWQLRHDLRPRLPAVSPSAKEPSPRQ